MNNAKKLRNTEIFKQNIFKTLLIIFVVIMSVYFATPSLMTNLDKDASLRRYLPNTSVNLGLDLQGGVSLLLDVNFDEYLRDKLESYSQDLKSMWYRNRGGDFSNIAMYIDINKEGVMMVNLIESGDEKLNAKNNRNVIDYRDQSEFAQKFEKIVREIFDYGSYEIITNKAENEKMAVKNNHMLTDASKRGKIKMGDSIKASFAIKLNGEFVNAIRSQLIDQSIEIVRRRIDESGTKEIDIQKQGDGNILLQIPGIYETKNIRDLLGRTAKLTFHFVNTSISEFDIANGAPLGSKLLFMTRDVDEDVDGRDVEGRDIEGKGNNEEVNHNVNDDANSRGKKSAIKYPVVVYSKHVMRGDSLTHASASLSEGKYVVNFRLDTVGTEKFANITLNNVGKPLAIVLDNEVISVATINTPINGGSGIISGNFTAKAASDLALLLRSGALPTKLEIVEERVIGSTLGHESIIAGKRAIILSFFAITLVMLVLYRFWGLLASFALIFNITMIVSVMGILGATLTLPGVAGIVLTIGMAVDANVLIFERMREELRISGDVARSIVSGYDMAFSTIVDANLTTVIAVLILYIFSSGPIRGFSIALIIGILTSMFTSVVCTKTIAWAILRTRLGWRLFG